MKKKTPAKKSATAKKIVTCFSVRHYRFFPCVWSASIRDGYKYYLAMRRNNSYRWLHELDSYRFKSIEEAKKFAENNKDTSFIPT